MSDAGTPGSGAPLAGRAVERAWFARPALEVAHGLLGAVLRVERPDGVVAVRLSEVEAYGGAQDPASHAYRGRTTRNASMFEAPGRLYVYRHLGLHRCANVVTGPAGTPSAVLLRAGEVVLGADVATRRRRAEGVVRREVDLARGPARLAVALGLSLEDDGADLLGAGVALTVPSLPGPVACGPRVGVSGPGADAERFGWRLWVPQDPTVSTWRAGTRGRRGAGRATDT